MSDTPQTTTPAPGSAPSAAASSPALPGGVVHELPADLAASLLADPPTAQLWRGLTPLGRNEFVCWVEDAKKPETRARRIRRTGEEMHEGKRRPCCWPGCKHRERTGR
ncbi:hypothetical protein KVA01_22060 [Kocuria varians]|uniref:Bacteriocin-protection protein n=1 Tax=Kocuria varians TaxID=1272 RepID=A0A4Y4D4D3_KOCVA|nr:YdeI/OmpD-associated family protein [Kocuria varians]GED00052.1 hypothetical protein KVA01_22060 [Kocuria varians]